MSALGQFRLHQASSHVGSFIERVAELAARFGRSVSQRQALHELARLDDRMLKDIGLFRSDIDSAESLPLGRDPIAHLSSRRATRSKARFANHYY